MSQNQYFRAGAGAVIYNDERQIFIFRRNEDRDIWQFPQGGMDPDEAIETTLWRELEEETGLDKESIALVTTYPDWLSYIYPEEMRDSLRDKNCLGQIHRWYFLKIKPGINIDLSKVSHPEFTDFKTINFEDFLKQNDSLKGDVFRKLAEFFKTI
jgi:putative (di)nucleoside polyphosphate hydrolase